MPGSIILKTNKNMQL